MAQQLLRQSFSKVLSRHPPSGHVCANSFFLPQSQTDISKQQQRVRMSVWEKDRKSGYGRGDDEPKRKRVKDGVKMVGQEMGMWGEEVKQKFRLKEGLVGVEHKDCKCVWNFHDQGKVDAWTVTADSDNHEGHSQAKFVLSKNKTGLFHGRLSTQVPKDGVTKLSGYCNIRSPTKRLSFKEVDTHDWTAYTHLQVRVRGDGRSYMLVISMDRTFDTFWHDQYHYALFTHGGPYWQTAKIPFSKFYATSKGRIRDQQSPIQLDKVTHLGITLGDNNEGPFSLEMDSISVTFDDSHEEQFAYES